MQRDRNYRASAWKNNLKEPFTNSSRLAATTLKQMSKMLTISYGKGPTKSKINGV